MDIPQIKKVKQPPQRRSIRLPDYDYSAVGYYYVTMCTQDRKEMFGEINDGKMIVNDVGKMVEEWWKKIPERFGGAELDVFQIMPNHMHGIVIINDIHRNVRAGFPRPHHGELPKPPIGRDDRAPTLGTIIGLFKSECTKQIRRLSGNPTMMVWQRNYGVYPERRDVYVPKSKETRHPQRSIPPTNP